MREASSLEAGGSNPCVVDSIVDASRAMVEKLLTT